MQIVGMTVVDSKLMPEGTLAFVPEGEPLFYASAVGDGQGGMTVEFTPNPRVVFLVGVASE